MISLTEFSKTVGFTNKPLSLRPVIEKFHALSVRDAIAIYTIRDFHRRTGADFGPLGVPMGDLQNTENGGYQQNYQLGNIKFQGLTAVPTAETSFTAGVTLSAIKCFGTQDNGPDETYAVISIISVNPNRGGADTLFKIIRTEIQENVKPGDVLFKMHTIGDAIPAGSGIAVHIAIWDHESGDADDITKKIAAVIEDATNKAASALAAGATASDPSVSAGTIGKITDFEVGGVKPFHILTLGLASLISHALADDLIQEHLFFIPAANIVAFANQDIFSASIRQSPELPFDVLYNWPPTVDDEKDFLFTDGHGTYKVYLTIQGGAAVHVVLPQIT